MLPIVDSFAKHFVDVICCILRLPCVNISSVINIGPINSFAATCSIWKTKLLKLLTRNRIDIFPMSNSSKINQTDLAEFSDGLS